MPDLIYLDYAATTPIDQRVVEVMLRHMGQAGLFANPVSALHSAGRLAAEAVEHARAQVAAAIGADAKEIVWTSGATEANNLAILGVAGFHRSRGRHLVSTAIEHASVLEPLEQLARKGYSITLVKPDRSGCIDPQAVLEALRPDTILVSVMHANNETGSVQDIAAIGAETRRRGVLLHSDAAQSLGKVPLDVRQMPVDLLSFSAHKQCGPKGVGALYLRSRPRVMLEPLLFGGGQERGLRPGTAPVHQVAGMGEAFAIASSAGPQEAETIGRLRDRLWQGLSSIPGIRKNGPLDTGDGGRRGLCNILNVSFPEITAQELARRAPQLAFSSGAACGSSGTGPSHVLQAMGLSAAAATGAVRFSLGRFTSTLEVDRAVETITMAAIGSDSY